MNAYKNSTSKRQFAAEGAVHFYSSPPSVLMPADIYTTRKNPQLMLLLETANIYVITLRRRIYLENTSLKRVKNKVEGIFLTTAPNGISRIPFAWTISDLMDDE